MITASKGWCTGGAKSMSLPVYSGGYTITNSPTLHKKWDVASVSGDWNIGDVITGRTSSAKGMLQNAVIGLSGNLTSVHFIVLSGTFTATGEIIDFASGGQCNLTNGGETYSSDHDSIWVQGTSDTDSGETITHNMGDVGIWGAIDSTTELDEYIASDETDWIVKNGAVFSVGQVLLVDEELVSISSKPAANRIVVVRHCHNTSETTHDANTTIYIVSMEVSDLDASLALGGIIRVDDEYMLVVEVDRTNDVALVIRGMFGSTIATHTSGASIYNVEDDLFNKIYEASAANGWGYVTCENGRIKADCQIYIGDPEQTSITRCLSKNETVNCVGSVFCVGNSSYDSELMSGRGVVEKPEYIAEGSTIRCQGDIFDANGIASTKNGKVYLFSSEISLVCSWENLITERVTVSPIKHESDDSYQGNMILFRTKSLGAPSKMTYWRDVLNSFGAYNSGSALIEYDRIRVGSGTYGLYFLTSGNANPEIYDLSIDSSTWEVFSFADGGNKYIINSGTVNIERWLGFWASTYYYEQYTVDITIQTKDGIAIPNVSVKAWDNAGTLVVDETTNASGQIATQTLTRNYKPNSGSVTNYEPFKWALTKAGWREQIFDENLDEQKIWIFTMQTKSPYTGE